MCALCGVQPTPARCPSLLDLPRPCTRHPAGLALLHKCPKPEGYSPLGLGPEGTPQVPHRAIFIPCPRGVGSRTQEVQRVRTQLPGATPAPSADAPSLTSRNLSDTPPTVTGISDISMHGCLCRASCLCVCVQASCSACLFVHGLYCMERACTRSGVCESVGL